MGWATKVTVPVARDPGLVSPTRHSQQASELADTKKVHPLVRRYSPGRPCSETDLPSRTIGVPVLRPMPTSDRARNNIAGPAGRLDCV